MAKEMVMTPDELREKVAEELWQAESVRAVGTRRNIPWCEAGPAAHNQWYPLAAAAIAVVLEEAARVADKMAFNQAIGIASENGEEQRWFEHGKYVADQTAAAIRAMIPSGINSQESKA